MHSKVRKCNNSTFLNCKKHPNRKALGIVSLSIVFLNLFLVIPNINYENGYIKIIWNKWKHWHKLETYIISVNQISLFWLFSLSRITIESHNVKSIYGRTGKRMIPISCEYSRYHLLRLHIIVWLFIHGFE